MNSIQPLVRNERYRAVVSAVRSAVRGTHLKVTMIDDIRTVEIEGPRVDGYVGLATDGGFRVELWRHDMPGPYRTVHTRLLGEAVATAIAGAGREVGGRA